MRTKNIGIWSRRRAGREAWPRPESACRPGAGALLLIVGGAATTTLFAVAHGTTEAGVIAFGASLAAGGWVRQSDRWLLAPGLPVLGTGLGIALTTVAPPLAGYATSAVFIGLGAGIALGATLGRREWAVALALWLVAAGFAMVTIASRGTPASIPFGWVVGLVESALGLVLLLRRDVSTAPGEPRQRRASASPDTRPPTQLRRGALLVAGGLGISLVDRLSHNLYLVVLALGLAYLVAGVATRHRRSAESGMLLTCLGVAIVLTDTAPEVVAGIIPLVFAAIASAATVVLTLNLGSVAGIGRSLITLGVVLAVLAALPQAGPIDAVRTHLDVFIPVLPLASGIAVLARWAMQRMRAPHDIATAHASET
jgi:hypothetical protein